jgi:hypothetical protein
MRKSLVALIVTMCLSLTACTPLEQSARNTAAALQGGLGAAQTKYQTTCAATPTATACTVITKAIDAQNILVTATEAYCGWSTAAPPVVATATCVPVKSAAAGLQSAVNNATLAITELKGLL